MPMTIYPYLLGQTWVFDDEQTGLKEEAFVLGMTEMVTKAVKAKRIPNAENGFALSFDAVPFDRYDVELEKMPPNEVPNQQPDEMLTVGNWYRGEVFGQEMIGWLCPALLLYFQCAPLRIYVKAEPLPEGIDPIWHIAADDPRATRFMSPDDDDLAG